MKPISLYLAICIALALFSCGKKADQQSGKEGVQTASITPKKVLFLNSYHEGYEWSDGIEKGVASVFANHPEIEIVYQRMDTKRNNNKESIDSAVVRAHTFIDSLKPDLIITSDDNAAKFVIAPFYKDSKIPVVFTGVNWDASEYGFPCTNVTGMIEVQLIDQIIGVLKKHTKGERIAFLKGNDASAVKESEFFEKRFSISLDKIFVSTFDEWVNAYKKIQGSADILLLGNSASIPDWDSTAAIQIINQYSKIPSGNWDAWMAPYSLVTFATVPTEQGEWAAQRALEIFAGKLPSEIQLVENKKAKVIVNMSLAAKLKIVFPTDFLENANFVGLAVQKIAFINSYHTGYEWSDAIELAFLKTLGVATPSGKDSYVKGNNEIRFYRMDAKNNPTEPFQKKRAMEIRKELDQWKPDVIVAADDDASKWLIVPYYKNSTVPVLFCGLNWDASVYGFPTKNVTGMVEVAPVVELLAFLKKIGTGERVAYLGANVLSEQKEIDHYKKRLHLQFSDGKLVNTAEEWKKAFLHYQKTADILLLVSHVGIQGWDDREMKAFVEKNSIIPSGTTTREVRPYSLLTFARVAEEQGWWAGEQVKAVLSGTAIETIGTTINQRSAKYANPILMKKNKIRIPADMVDSVTLE